MDMAEKEETEGRCPACRSPYDKEKIVGMEAKCEMLAAKKDRENKPQKPKPKKQEERKDLANVRVIQRKMAYVIGLPLTLADEDLLQRKDYFGQYGKVCKVSLSRTAGGAIQQFVNDTCSVYITYSKEEEAIRCIQSVHGFVLEGKSLRASFGTAKYCHAWLKNVACNNPACLYLHSIGADEDSFGKDEEAAVHTRNRVHQIVGATHNMQQKSGTTLPPPLDNPLNGSSITTDKFSSHSVKKELNSNGALACSVSSKDQDGRIKTPNRSFVDVVARTNSGPEHGNITEDRKLLNSCSDFSSVVTDQNFSQPEYIDAMPSRVSSISRLTVPVADKESQHYTVKSYRDPESHLQIAVQDKDTQHYTSNPFRDPSKFSVLGMADYTKQQSCFVSSSSHGNLGEGLFHSGDQVSVLAATFPVKFSDCSIDHAQHRKEISGARDIYADCRNVNNYPNDVSVPFGGVNSASANRFVEARSQSNYSNSFSNGEIVGQLRRLDGDNITNNSDSSALDAVESSIISSILSMDFDSCDDSLTVPHSLAELYAGSSGRHGAFRNSIKSDQSRFSFAKEDSCPKEASDFNSSFSYIDQSKKYSLFTDQIGKNSMEKENYCMCGPQNQGSRTSLTPPGFSVPSRDPPPGFSSFERTNQLHFNSSGVRPSPHSKEII